MNVGTDSMCFLLYYGDCSQARWRSFPSKSSHLEINFNSKSIEIRLPYAVTTFPCRAPDVKCPELILVIKMQRLDDVNLLNSGNNPLDESLAAAITAVHPQQISSCGEIVVSGNHDAVVAQSSFEQRMHSMMAAIQRLSGRLRYR